MIKQNKLFSFVNQKFNNVLQTGEVLAADETVMVILSELPLLSKPSQLSVRLNKHWRHIVNKSMYCENVLELDSFTVDLIQEVQELQALQVNTVSRRMSTLIYVSSFITTFSHFTLKLRFLLDIVR